MFPHWSAQFRDFPSITTPAAPAPPAGATHRVAAAHGTLKAIGCLLWWPLGRALRFRRLVMAFFNGYVLNGHVFWGMLHAKIMECNKAKWGYDMIWYDIWYDMIYDMIWYDIWYDMIYDMIWYDIWYDMIWYEPATIDGDIDIHLTKRWGYNTNKLVGIYTANSI
jgi:hypothetical protein